MALKNLYLFFGSLSCASMSRVSKLVNTILNGLLSPLKTPNYALFQIPKNHISNLLKSYFKPLLQFCKLKKQIFFFFKEFIFLSFASFSWSCEFTSPINGILEKENNFLDLQKWNKVMNKTIRRKIDQKKNTSITTTETKNKINL